MATNAARSDSHAQTHTDKCSICLDPLCDDDKPIEELECGHQFHLPCIRDWNSRNSTCPICRKEFALPPCEGNRPHADPPPSPGAQAREITTLTQAPIVIRDVNLRETESVRSFGEQAIQRRPFAGGYGVSSPQNRTSGPGAFASTGGGEGFLFSVACCLVVCPLALAGFGLKMLRDSKAKISSRFMGLGALLLSPFVAVAWAALTTDVYCAEFGKSAAVGPHIWHAGLTALTGPVGLAVIGVIVGLYICKIIYDKYQPENQDPRTITSQESDEYSRVPHRRYAY